MQKGVSGSKNDRHFGVFYTSFFFFLCVIVCFNVSAKFLLLHYEQ